MGRDIVNFAINMLIQYWCSVLKLFSLNDGSLFFVYIELAQGCSTKINFSKFNHSPIIVVIVIPCEILYTFVGLGHGASEIVRICEGECHKNVCSLTCDVMYKVAY